MGVGQRDRAATVRRAHKRGGTRAEAVEVGVERQPRVDDFLVGLQDSRRIGIGERDMAVADQAVRVAAKRQVAGDMTAGKTAVDILQRDFVWTKLRHAFEIARNQRRREHRMVERESHGAVHRGERAAAERLARPRPGGVLRLARQPQQHARQPGTIDSVGTDVAVDCDRARQIDGETPVRRRLAGGDGNLRERQRGAGNRNRRARGDRHRIARLAGHCLLQRPKVGGGCQYLERTRRRFLAVQPRRTAHRSSKTAGRCLAVDAKLAVQRSDCRQRHAAGQLIDGDDAIEAEQRRQRGTVVGVEPAVDAHIRFSELGWLDQSPRR